MAPDLIYSVLEHPTQVVVAEGICHVSELLRWSVDDTECNVINCIYPPDLPGAGLYERVPAPTCLQHCHCHGIVTMQHHFLPRSCEVHHLNATHRFRERVAAGRNCHYIILYCLLNFKVW